MVATSSSRFQRSHLRTVVQAALGTAAFLASSTASARDVYPGAIQQHLGSPCAPLCTLCHTVPEGGGETVRETEGFYVDLATLSPGTPPDRISDVESLLQYIDQNLANPMGGCQVATDPNYLTGPCDYDRDGKSDYDELRVGEDPNVSGPGAGCGSAVTYGCGARVAPAPPEKTFDALALLLSLATAAALLVRVRR